MEQNENNYSLFIKGLRNRINDSNFDYKIIESVLFSRISEAEGLKEFAILKLDEMPSAEKLDNIEQKLFSQIIQYNEYEIPTNECISTEYNLSDSQWERLTAKIEGHIKENDALPEWEKVIKAFEKEPLEGEWERIEDSLFEKIGIVSYRDKWEQCARIDEINILESLESVERKLDDRIKKKQNLEIWECILKTEKILPYKQWEDIEDCLFDKINNQTPSLSLSKQPFWHVVDYYLLISRLVKVASVTMLLTLLIVGGYLFENRINEKIPTLVYQLQGSSTGNAAGLLGSSVNDQYNSQEGGAISLVNSHGLVELQNGSEIEVDQLTRKHALYKVNFKETANGEIAKGKIAFLVNPHHGKESFKVQTPDYQIVVKGTYFKVEPDLGGKISTRVLEGEVKVVSKLFKETSIKAGQSLVYDLFTNQYKIQGGGTVVQRKELESVPDVDELFKCKVISIKSSVSDADIRIDGKYFGTAPLTIRQSTGFHRIWVGKNGYTSIDTLITLTDFDSLFSLNVVLNVIQNRENTVIQEIPRENKVNQKSSTISPEIVAEQLLGQDSAVSEVDSIYNLALKVESKGNWKEAIQLYKGVFDNPNFSRLRKEDALFSVGKLQAEHEGVQSEARETFLTYLALYSGGSFAGETWLRLAEIEFKTNPENAVQYYLKYFEMFPRHPRISELQNRVGIIYLQQKKYDEAISLFRQSLSNLISPAKGERENITLNLHRALEAKNERNADTLLRQHVSNSSAEK